MARVLLLSVLALLAQSCRGFNIELRQVVRKQGPAGTYFGTSVSFHSSAAAPITSATDFILAGAPLADRALPAAASTIEPGFKTDRPGALFRCSDLSVQNSATDCTEMNQDMDTQNWWPVNGPTSPFLLNANVYSGPLFFRRQGRFGLSVVSSGPGGEIRVAIVRRPGGYCVDTNADFTRLGLIRYCHTTDFGLQFASLARFACNGGVSNTYIESTNPALYDDTFVTTVAQGSLLNNGHYTRNSIVYNGGATTSDARVNAGIEASARGAGYASATAVGQHRVLNFRLQPGFHRSQFCLALHRGWLCTPHPERVKGALLDILDGQSDFINYNIMFLGTQDSAGFGFSLVTGNFDGVEGSDLAIGAPFHTNYIQPRNFENGIVAYYSGGFITKRWNVSIPEDASNGRSQYSVPEKTFMGANRAQLGYALANIGDTNRDSYDELAVGAPGINTVYIYYGRPGGLSEENRQVIAASDLQSGIFSASLNRFGYSLSTTQFHAPDWDMDANGYADLLVGAPGSDAVVYLKARPVVHMQATFAFTPNLIDFQRCLDNRNAFCFGFTVCFSVNSTLSAGVFAGSNVRARLSVCEGTAANQCATTQRLAARTWLNSQGTAVLDPNVERIVPLDSVSTLCFNYNATLVTTISDKLAPLRILGSWTVVDVAPTNVDSLTPIGTRFGRQNSLGQLNVQKDCVAITCYPDMYIRSANLTMVDGTSVDSILLGEVRLLTISVEVGNLAEPATTPTITVLLPTGTSLASAADGSACTAAAAGSSSVVTCILSNPFERNQTASISINVAVSQLDLDVNAQDLRFIVQVLPDQRSTPENATVLADNTQNLTTSVARRSGFSSTGTIIQGASITLTSGGTVENVMRDSDFGPVVSIRYSLLASGPSALPDSYVELEYPDQLKDAVSGVSRFILYLTEVRALESGITCNLRGIVNPSGVITPTPVDVPTQDDSLTTSQECVNPLISYCTRRIQCRFGRINPGGAKTLQLTYRVANATFVQQSLVPVQLETSFRVLNITTPPGFTLEGTPGNGISLTVDVQNPIVLTTEKANIGIIIGSAVGGLALIVIIILVLWKIGFFKRAKLDDMDAGGNGGGNGGGEQPVTYNKDEEAVGGVHSDV